MYFILSKTVALLVVPSNLLILSILIGFVLTWTRWSRAGRWLATTAFVLLLALGYLPVGRALSHALENRFRSGIRRAARPTASSSWAG